MDFFSHPYCFIACLRIQVFMKKHELWCSLLLFVAKVRVGILILVAQSAKSFHKKRIELKPIKFFLPFWIPYITQLFDSLLLFLFFNQIDGASLRWYICSWWFAYMLKLRKIFQTNSFAFSYNTMKLVIEWFLKKCVICIDPSISNFDLKKMTKFSPYVDFEYKLSTMCFKIKKRENATYRLLMWKNSQNFQQIFTWD
jgi:hypothetical protein